MRRRPAERKGTSKKDDGYIYLFCQVINHYIPCAFSDVLDESPLELLSGRGSRRAEAKRKIFRSGGSLAGCSGNETARHSQSGGGGRDCVTHDSFLKKGKKLLPEKAGKDDPSGRENGQRSRGAFRGLGMAVFPFQTWNAAGTYVRELWSRTPNFCVIHEHQYVKQFVPSARSFMRAGVARAGRGRHGGYRSAVCSREEIRTFARQPAAGEGGRVSPTLLWQSIFRLKRFAFQTIRSVASR